MLRISSGVVLVPRCPLIEIPVNSVKRKLFARAPDSEISCPRIARAKGREIILLLLRSRASRQAGCRYRAFYETWQTE
jgi:hypothetical protein